MSKPAIILIVDDIASNRQTLWELLDMPDYALFEASDGPSALRLASEIMPDLVLLDVMMPCMDGFEVCRRLRAKMGLAEVPVIMVTALDDAASRLNGIEAGADDFITKPFNRAELRARVKTITRLNRYRRLLETQTELLSSEVRFRTLFTKMDEGFCVVEILFDKVGQADDYLFLEVNPSFERQFGLREAAGKSVRELIPSIEKIWVKRFGDVALTGDPVRFSERIESLNRCFDVYAFRPGGPESRVVASLFSDITERKLAEESLRQSEENYRELIESANDLILKIIPDGRLTHANRAGRAALGYSMEELGRLKFADLISPDQREQAENMLNDTSAKNIQLIDVDFVSKSNRRIPAEGSICAKVVEGQIVSLLCIFRDVTEKRKMESQLLRNQRMESIGTLAGGIAHDLNNVLAPILMAVELLRIKLKDEGSEQILQTLALSARRGAEMVKQVLTFSRGVEGKKVTVQMALLIAEMKTIVDQTFPKSIQLRTEISKGLLCNTGDATQLHQVLLNLCVNARDAMPQGGTLTITAENFSLDESFARMNPGTVPGPYILLRVADTGTGMSQEIQNRIFDPFFTTKTLDKGTGLGLSTVLGIVKNHQGFMIVHSEIGRGTEFNIYLPATLNLAALEFEGRKVSLPVGHGELILVVDDEAGIRSILQQVLEMFGYRVLTANDGVGAVVACAQKKEEIQLMITDMMMPIMDGTSAILAVKSIIPAIKIIAASGLDMPGGKGPEQIQADAFLHKPYTSERLLTLVGQVLALH